MNLALNALFSMEQEVGNGGGDHHREVSTPWPNQPRLLKKVPHVKKEYTCEDVVPIYRFLGIIMRRGALYFKGWIMDL